jgi:hypothetical protein
MIPSAVPKEIVELHRALLEALRVDYFPPGIIEMNCWKDFLFVMKPLAESAGGAFTVRDISPAVALMREQNKAQGANWSLRYAKIMRDPESFRDFVLQARKTKRTRPPVATKSVRTPDGANVQVEHDAAAESEPTHISNSLREWREKMQRGGGTP